ncbi:hypothetical protein Pla163_02320 [Planctomycetes bacterium Pla163]|uniref:Peptidase C39-like domain-containing protein n=1 Tax=Rohdeia mirabilis TaxID=2528008 RepID=A0A518CV81_9BACT|nr:hypothetical protein Pla163_02320 [Planctomycetes bacterium Pla163]
MPAPLEFEPAIVDAHEQKFEASCIPSCVELVLKLLKRVDFGYYDEQNAWGSTSDGSFGNFNNRVLFGLRFRNLFFEHPRGAAFPLADLFSRISVELDEGRFVIISLASSAGWHMYVVYAQENGEFRAISKASPPHGHVTIAEDKVKAAVAWMQGTDILVYE